MSIETHFGIFDFLIFLGIFQGLFISWFFIKKGLNGVVVSLYNGILFLTLSLSMLEEFLNHTELILKVLPLSNYSEAFNFVFGPLIFLAARSMIFADSKKADWPHFVMMFFWIIYMVFYFMQPSELKYNSHVFSKHPDWEIMEVSMKFSEDPLGIRKYVNEMTALHFSGYIIATVFLVNKKLKSIGQSFFNIKDKAVKAIRGSLLHFSVIVIIFIFVKLYFGRDLGDYFISSYISLMIILTSYQVINNSRFFDESHTFMEIPVIKYQKSSLSEERKEEVLKKIEAEMINNKYFTNNLASLSGLAKLINESNHHVSQVINDKLGKNFYNLLATYRVEEAKRILKEDTERNVTVEELAERVGYNSKSSFNNAFKSITSQTPSDFRKNP